MIRKRLGSDYSFHGDTASSHIELSSAPVFSGSGSSGSNGSGRPGNASSRWMTCMHVGCRLSKLYTIGIIATIPCGGAVKDSLERRLTNDATRVAGRYLKSDCKAAGIQR